MAYTTYTTEAIVCGTFNRNTADRSYLLFTREAGMLFADARSVREERSRQRFGLQDFSYIRVSLVKGKAGWKIGSTEPRGNYFQQAVDQSARGSVVTIIRFLRRFYQGEEATPQLFDDIREALETLSKTQEERKFIELVLQVRFLVVLGYVGVSEVPGAIYTTPVSELAELYTNATEQKLRIILDRAVVASHL